LMKRGVLPLLALILAASIQALPSAGQDEGLTVRAEYRVDFEGLLAFPVRGDAVNCTCEVDECTLIAVVAPENLTVRTEYFSGGNTSWVYIETIANVSIYESALDGGPGVRYACNRQVRVEANYTLLPGGLAIDGSNESVAPVVFAPVFVAPPLGGYRIAYVEPSYYGSWGGVLFDTKEAAEEFAAFLQEALRETGLEDVALIEVREWSGGGYIVEITPTAMPAAKGLLEANPRVDLALRVGGYASTIAPPPGREFAFGDVNFSALETAGPGSPNETIKIVGDNLLIVWVKGSLNNETLGYLLVFYRPPEGPLASVVGVVKDLSVKGENPIVGGLLYHWASGGLLEINYTMVDASRFYRSLELYRAADPEYFMKVHHVPAAVIVDGAPETAASYLDPDVAATFLHYITRFQAASIRAVSYSFDAPEGGGVVEAGGAPVGLLAAVAVLAVVAGVVLARRGRR